MRCPTHGLRRAARPAGAARRDRLCGRQDLRPHAGDAAARHQEPDGESGLARALGARVGANITVQTSDGARLNAQVVGLFHAGIRSIDESTAYVLIKTAQILAQQTGLVNEIRVRVSDAMAARTIAQRIERETGYK